jgi:hypothetical protein
VVGLPRQLEVEHPWVLVGFACCWIELESKELLEGAHTLAEILIFLDHNPERQRADRLAQRVAYCVPSAPPFHWDPLAADYGFTRLHVAERPDSRWRSVFSDSQIEG